MLEPCSLTDVQAWELEKGYWVERHGYEHVLVMPHRAAVAYMVFARLSSEMDYGSHFIIYPDYWIRLSDGTRYYIRHDARAVYEVAR